MFLNQVFLRMIGCLGEVVIIKEMRDYPVMHGTGCERYGDTTMGDLSLSQLRSSYSVNIRRIIKFINEFVMKFMGCVDVHQDAIGSRIRQS